MKYLPILDELFNSNSFIFLVIGLIVTIIIGLRMNNKKKVALLGIVALISYIICEWSCSNIHTSYMGAFVLLFIGTTILGSFVGCLSSLMLISLIKKHKKA